jgi:hypothetical protein
VSRYCWHILVDTKKIDPAIVISEEVDTSSPNLYVVRIQIDQGRICPKDALLTNEVLIELLREVFDL